MPTDLAQVVLSLVLLALRLPAAAFGVATPDWPVGGLGDSLRALAAVSTPGDLAGMTVLGYVLVLAGWRAADRNEADRNEAGGRPAS